jgi:hypothetical protein
MDPASMGITLFNGLMKFTAILQQRLDNTKSLDIDSARDDHQILNSWHETLAMGDYIGTVAKRWDVTSLSSLLNIRSVLDLLRCLCFALGSADLLLREMTGPLDAFVDDPKLGEHGVHSPGDVCGKKDILDQHFAKIYMAFIQLRQILDAHESLNDRTTSREPLYSIQSSFYNQPFDIMVEERYAEEIANQLGSINSDSDIYTLAVQEMAKQWVDDKLKPTSTTQDRGEAQSAVLTVLSSVLSAEMTYIEESVMNALQVEPLSYARLVELRDRVKKEIDRERDKRFSIALCGLVKAGWVRFASQKFAKFTPLLLASPRCSMLSWAACSSLPVVGTALSTLATLLLHRHIELPSTACPCRIQHVKGQSEPILTIDQEYFQNAIEELRSKKPIENDRFSFFDNQNAFDDLDPISVENSSKFKQYDYRIPGHASGDDDVKDLVHSNPLSGPSITHVLLPTQLMQVNDVIRLCSRLNLKLHPPDPNKWPRLEIEIEALRDKHLEGSFEVGPFFISVAISTDLPLMHS